MNLMLKFFIKDYTNTADTKVREQYGKLSGAVGIIVNVFLFISKLVVGTIAGSIAITADAFNNLTDASSSVITLVGFKLSNKPADKDHPYGHARYEYIAALAVAVMTMVVGFELFISSVKKVMNPSMVSMDSITAIVLIGSILIKGWLALFNYSLSKKIDSPVLKATAIDSRNDMVSTGVVLIGVTLGSIFNLHLDGYFGLSVAIFILFSGLSVVSEILSLLLGERPDPELVKMINRKIMSYDTVLGNHDLIVHDYGPGHRFASVHVEMDSDMPALECHEIIDNIERDFKEQDGLEIVIHHDPIVTTEGEFNDLRSQLHEVVTGISPLLHFHDFRYVPSHGHTNLIFDLVVPHEFGYETQELKDLIEEAFNTTDKKYYCVITFDFDFCSH